MTISEVRLRDNSSLSSCKFVRVYSLFINLSQYYITYEWGDLGCVLSQTGQMKRVGKNGKGEWVKLVERCPKSV